MVNGSELSGKVQTVLGLISPDDLGIAITHEHLILDLSFRYKKPDSASDVAMADKPISLENLNWIQHHKFNYPHIWIMADVQEVINETMLFKLEGGNAIVDLTNSDHWRDPLAIARISRATGLHIVMGGGYYVAEGYRQNMDKKTEEDVVDDIVREVTEGADGTHIRSGIIGELGCSWPLDKNEEKVLRAAARAQQITGAPINIHPGRHKDAPLQILKILGDSGADLHHVVIGDVDLVLRTHEDRCAVAETGCYLEYNHFGQEGYHTPTVDVPNDHYRINEIIALIKHGFLDRILVGHDTCKKIMFCRYGGHGYAHILRYAVPVMRFKGMTEEQINAIFVENPKRMLTFI